MQTTGGNDLTAVAIKGHNRRHNSLKRMMRIHAQHFRESHEPLFIHVIPAIEHIAIFHHIGQLTRGLQLVLAHQNSGTAVILKLRARRHTLVRNNEGHMGIPHGVHLDERIQMVGKRHIDTVHDLTMNHQFRAIVPIGSISQPTLEVILTIVPNRRTDIAIDGIENQRHGPIALFVIIDGLHQLAPHGLIRLIVGCRISIVTGLIGNLPITAAGIHTHLGHNGLPDSVQHSGRRNRIQSFLIIDDVILRIVGRPTHEQITIPVCHDAIYDFSKRAAKLDIHTGLCGIKERSIRGAIADAGVVQVKRKRIGLRHIHSRSCNRRMIGRQIGPHITGLNPSAGSVFRIQYPTNEDIACPLCLRQFRNRLTIGHLNLTGTAIGNMTGAGVQRQIEPIRLILRIQRTGGLHGVILIEHHDIVHRHNRVFRHIGIHTGAFGQHPAQELVTRFRSSGHIAHLLIVGHRRFHDITADNIGVNLIAGIQRRDIECRALTGDIGDKILTGCPGGINIQTHAAIAGIAVSRGIRGNSIAVAIDPTGEIIAGLCGIGLRQSLIKLVAIDNIHLVKDIGRTVGRIIPECQRRTVALIEQIHHSRTIFIGRKGEGIILTSRGHTRTTLVKRIQVIRTQTHLIADEGKPGNLQTLIIMHGNRHGLIRCTDHTGNSLVERIGAIRITEALCVIRHILCRNLDGIGRIGLQPLRFHRNVMRPAIPACGRHQHLFGGSEIIIPAAKHITGTGSRQQTRQTVCHIRTGIAAELRILRRAVCIHMSAALTGVKRNGVDVTVIVNAEYGATIGFHERIRVRNNRKAVQCPPCVIRMGNTHICQSTMIQVLNRGISNVIIHIFQSIGTPQIVGLAIGFLRGSNTLLITRIRVLMDKVDMNGAQLNPMLNFVAHILRSPVRIQVLRAVDRIIQRILENLLAADRFSKPTDEVVTDHRHIRQTAVGLRGGLHRLLEHICVGNRIMIEVIRSRVRSRRIALVGMEPNDILSQTHVVNHGGLTIRGMNACNQRRRQIPVLAVSRIIGHSRLCFLVIIAVIHLLTFQNGQRHVNLIPLDNIEALTVIQNGIV